MPQYRRDPSPELISELESLAPWACLDASSNKGRWLLFGDKPFTRLHLDYGCGMGEYLVELAKRDAATLFIGVEQEHFCVAKAAQRGKDAKLPNVLFLPAPSPQAASLLELFSTAELDCISVNFPTPHPRAAQAEQRMIHQSQLGIYRQILSPTGVLRFKTDSQPLYDYSLSQFPAAGFEIFWQSHDLHKDAPSDPLTGYEARLAAQGAPIFALQARPSAAAVSPQALQRAQSAARSLYDYLPQDLASLDYIPTDMRRSVQNMLEAQARVEAARQLKPKNRQQN